MFEIMAIAIGIFVAWKLLQGVLNTISPARGLKIAERRYMENPTDQNYSAMLRAASRVNR